MNVMVWVMTVVLVLSGCLKDPKFDGENNDNQNNTNNRNNRNNQNNGGDTGLDGVGNGTLETIRIPEKVIAFDFFELAGLDKDGNEVLVDSFEVDSGMATIEETTLFADAPGPVRIRAVQGTIDIEVDFTIETPEISEVRLGRGFVCALVSTIGRVICRGRNDEGQLGNSSNASILNEWSRVSLEPRVKTFDASRGSACAITEDDEIYCWGQTKEDAFLVGVDPLATSMPTPMQVVDTPFPEERPFDRIQVGANAACISVANSNFCWGDNTNGASSGETGEGVTTMTPVGTGFSLTMGGEVGLLRSTTGRLMGWGLNDSGQIDPGPSMAFKSPTEIAPTLDVIGPFDTSGQHSCAVMIPNGGLSELYCWGASGAWLGGSDLFSVVPVMGVVGPNINIDEVSVGIMGSCILLNDETVQCWGPNSASRFGEAIGAPVDPKPVDVGATGDIVQIELEERNLCVLSAGEVWCLGGNESEQIRRTATQEINVALRVAWPWE